MEYHKKPDEDNFKWLHVNKVFLNHTKFKTDTLVPCGFLLSALPGFSCHNEAELDFKTNISPENSPVPLQLSLQSVSVALSSCTTNRLASRSLLLTP
jgi:hypothetical protein